MINNEDKDEYAISFDYSALENRIRLSTEEHAFLAYQEEHKKSAVGKGVKNCQSCGMCCKKAPCKLVKADVKRLADLLHMSSKELFNKYLTVDKYNDIYYVVPIRLGQEDIAGKYISNTRTFIDKQACVFLDLKGSKYKCKVHNAKPQEGVNFKCWEASKVAKESYGWDVKDLESLGWEDTYIDNDFDCFSVMF